MDDRKNSEDAIDQGKGSTPSGNPITAIGIPLLRGTLIPDDVPRPPAPVPFLVSEAAARRFWPDRDAVGQLVRLRGGRGREAIVVGVVGDVRQLALRDQPVPAVYFPQATGPRLVTTLVARTGGDPESLAGPIRAAIRALDPNQAIRSITTLEDVVEESVARDRFFTFLFGAFGGLAVVIAGIGVYGLFAYAVAQRTQEIGVRMALGASRGSVLALVFRQGVQLIAVGLTLGVAGSLWATRPLEGLLYQTSPRDVLTLAIVSAVPWR